MGSDEFLLLLYKCDIFRVKYNKEKVESTLIVILFELLSMNVKHPVSHTIDKSQLNKYWCACPTKYTEKKKSLDI